MAPKKSTEEAGKKKVTPAQRLGIAISPSQVAKQLKRRLPRTRFSREAIEMIAIALNTVASEVSNSSAKFMTVGKRVTLSADDVQRGASDKNDEDLKTFFDDIHVQGATLQNEAVNEQYMNQHFLIIRKPAKAKSA